MNVEHGTFTPLIFSINGGEGSECLAFHKHAEKIALKTDDRFEHVYDVDSYKTVFSGTASRSYVLKDTVTLEFTFFLKNIFFHKYTVFVIYYKFSKQKV